MASPLKKLAGQTAIYGLSSILGRFLNYMLTPLYTSALVFTTEQYGVITEMYSYVAFLVVILMYGMETAFFRYFSEEGRDNSTVYSTALWSLLITSFSFIALASLFAQPLADLIHYPNHSEYVSWFAIIVGLDALITIPLARLRAQDKALRFAMVNFCFIGVNIGLNLFFLVYCLDKYALGETNWLIETFYSSEIGVGYVFIANLIASVFRFLFVIPEFSAIRRVFDVQLWKKMLAYSTPLLLVGLAGITNDHLDKILLKWLLEPLLGKEEAMIQLGIYGGVYKLSIAITLFVQAYRYAAEPFFFDQKKNLNAKPTYARMLHLFTAFVLFSFLIITLFMDLFKHFLQSEIFWSALDVVPVLLMANIFLGIYYNLSLWYKLTDRTIYGSYIAMGGAVITILLNLWWIPIFGFRGSAWATFCCYLLMACTSYFFGQKHYKVPYNLLKLGGYFALAIAIFFINRLLPFDSAIALIVIRVLLLGTYLGIVGYIEFIKPKNDVPIH